MCACIYVYIFPSSTHREDLGAVHPNSMHILSTHIVVSKYPFSNKKTKTGVFGEMADSSART